jgi:hypothetical protein
MPQNRLFLPKATWAAAALVVVALGASCGSSSGDAAAAGGSTPTSTPSAATSSDPAPASTASASAPAGSGPPSPSTCAGGWKVPAAGSELATFPLHVIHEMSHHGGTFKVVAMRYFVGGESPPEPDKPYLQNIERWYVKLYDPVDPSFRGRFLVERRPFGSSVAAVAPFDTHGFTSPDWRGLEYESSDATPKSYPGIPGTWSGVTYDFVNGGNGINLPGLPADLAGCLDGT